MWHFAYTPGRAFCKMARLGISVTWRLISSSTRTVKSSRISLCPQFTFLVAVHPLLVNCSLLLAAFYFPVVDGTHNMLSKTSHPCPVVLPQWLKLLFYTHQFSFVNTPAASLGVEQQWPPHSVHTARNSKVLSCVWRPIEANGAAHLNVYCALAFFF